MHRRMIGAAMIVGLTSGLLGTAAYTQFVRPAFADTGPLSGLATREQNLDANGLIRVHEQGTPTVSVGNFPLDANGNLKVAGSANVSGTVNVGNLPATQPVSGTVNVGNLPATQPVSGTVTVGNFPATQNVNIVGGSTTAGLPILSKGQSAGGHLDATSSKSFALSINASYIRTFGCSNYDFEGPNFIGVLVGPGQTLIFPYAIPLTEVSIENNDTVFGCDGTFLLLGT